MDIKYIDHPCSTEQKKEWNAKGYKVIDSKFAPVEQVEQEAPKRKSKQKKD